MAVMVFGYLIFVIWLGENYTENEKNCMTEIFFIVIGWEQVNLSLILKRAQSPTTITMLYSLETLKHIYIESDQKNCSNLTALETIS